MKLIGSRTNADTTDRNGIAFTNCAVLYSNRRRQDRFIDLLDIAAQAGRPISLIVIDQIAIFAAQDNDLARIVNDGDRRLV